MKNWRIGVKLACGFGVLILMTVLIGSLFTLVLWHVARQSASVKESYLPLSMQSATLNAGVMQSLGCFADYLATGEERLWHLTQSQLNEALAVSLAISKLTASQSELAQERHAASQTRMGVVELEQSLSATQGLFTQFLNDRRILIQDGQAVDSLLRQAHHELLKRLQALQEHPEKTKEFLRLSRAVQTLFEISFDITAIRTRVLRGMAFSDRRMAAENLTELFDSVSFKEEQLQSFLLPGESAAPIELRNAMLTLETSCARVLSLWNDLDAMKLNRENARNNTLKESTSLAAAGARLTTNTVNHIAKNTIMVTLAVILFMLILALVAIAFSFILTRAITRPVDKAVAFAAAVANGELDQHLDVDRRDEIGVLTAALNAMVASLREKKSVEAASLAKNEFLANMSHEIRTPMSGIIGLTHLLQRTQLTEQQQDYAQKIGISAQTLLALINDILDFSKIEAGKLTLESIPYRLEGVLEQVVSVVRSDAEKKKLKLFVNISDGVPDNLLGDPLRLYQVLMNLCGNAVKFTRKGSISVAVCLEKNEEALVWLRFSVADTGIGMNRRQMDKIFEAFAQADTSTTRQFGGTGLGLSICTRLVGMMGGQLEVDSSPGIGSTFHFTLPCRLDETGETKKSAKGNESTVMPSYSPSTAMGRLEGVRILLTEDNDINQQIMLELLRSEGAVTDTADDGQEALEKLDGNSYDVILMDIQMPVMDGLTAASHIRAKGIATPIVALTANAMAGDAQKSLEAGMQAHVSKPIDPETLYRAIEECLYEG